MTNPYVSYTGQTHQQLKTNFRKLRLMVFGILIAYAIWLLITVAACLGSLGYMGYAVGLNLQLPALTSAQIFAKIYPLLWLVPLAIVGVVISHLTRPFVREALVWGYAVGANFQHEIKRTDPNNPSE